MLLCSFLFAHKQKENCRKLIRTKEERLVVHLQPVTNSSVNKIKLCESVLKLGKSFQFNRKLLVDDFCFRKTSEGEVVYLEHP